MLQDGGEWPKEEGDVIRVYKAMHEEKIPEQLAEGRWEKRGRNNRRGKQRNRTIDRQKEDKRRGERRERDRDRQKKVYQFCFD